MDQTATYFAVKYTTRNEVNMTLGINSEDNLITGTIWIVWIFRKVSNYVTNCLFITPPPVGAAEYCDDRVCVCVCVCVCLCASISPELHVWSLPIFCDCGSVVLRRRRDTLCTSGLWVTSFCIWWPKIGDAKNSLWFNCVERTIGLRMFIGDLV